MALRISASMMCLYTNASNGLNTPITFILGQLEKRTRFIINILVKKMENALECSMFQKNILSKQKITKQKKQN